MRYVFNGVGERVMVFCLERLGLFAFFGIQLYRNFILGQATISLPFPLSKTMG